MVLQTVTPTKVTPTMKPTFSNEGDSNNHNNI